MRVSGSEFVALVRIYMPEGKRVVLVADVGQPCGRVPADALARLEQRGKVKRVTRKKEQADV